MRLMNVSKNKLSAQCTTKRVPQNSTPYAPWLLIPTALAVLFLLVPMIAIFLRTPWTDFFSLISSEESLDALWLSLRTCFVTVAITFFFGLPFSFVLAYSQRPLITRILRVFVLLPMVLPPVVAGLALLLTWGRMGLIGKYLDVFGFSVGFSTLAVIFAQVFVSMPFFVISLEAAIRAQGQTFFTVARRLGASRTRSFFTVALPMMVPATLSSLALSFSRALGEFGATITFAGSLQGVTRTMPLQIYLQREADTDQALALAVVLIALAILMLGLANTLLADKHAKQSAPTDRTTKNRRDNGENLSAYGRRYQTVSTDNAVPVAGTKIAARPPESLAPATSPGIHISAEVAERAVRIDTHIKGGVVTAVMGSNGAGKSTMLELIAGTLQASSGGVSFEPNLAHPRIVLLEQKPLLFPHLSVVQNVAFGLRARHVPREKARERALAELDLVDMVEFADCPSNALSGGQAQRVAIARAMAISPDLVLLDEPFAGLDEDAASLVRTQLKTRLQAGSVTALLVTHDLLDAQYLAQEIILMRYGRVVERRLV